MKYIIQSALHLLIVLHFVQRKMKWAPGDRWAEFIYPFPNFNGEVWEWILYLFGSIFLDAGIKKIHDDKEGPISTKMINLNQFCFIRIWIVGNNPH